MSGELPAPGFTMGSTAKGKEAEGEREEEEPPISFSPSLPVSEQIHLDILAAEFLVGLFWSATNSFRHDSILRPFPPMYIEGGGSGEGEGSSEGVDESHRERTEGAEPPGGREGDKNKDIEGLRQVLGSLPALNTIASGAASLSTQQEELLHWVLNPKRFSVTTKEPHSFLGILNKVDSQSAIKLSQRPKYIFELNYNEESETKFHSISDKHGVMYAFHGSNVENFYSIVHNGLLNLFNKVAAFGEGTYLSTELGVCLNWSPSGSLWSGGALPQAASCVALCEVVKHPSVMSRYQVGGEPNLQQSVPEKYFIVTNDEFIRVKYVLVYEMQKPVVRSQGWLHRNKFVIVLVVYVIFLACVGASQSKVLRRLLRRYYSYLF